MSNMVKRPVSARTDRQKLFVQEFAMCGNATIAAQKAGYSNHSAAQIGCRLKNQFKDEIDKIHRSIITDAVPNVLNQIIHLATAATSEPVRLQACRNLLDRAGFKPTEKIEQTHIEDDRPLEELRTELAELMGEVQKPEVEYIPKNLN